jgi:hypothetical protein
MSRTDGGVPSREPGAELPRLSLGSSSAKTAARRLRRRAIAVLSIYAAVALGFGFLHALHVIH